ncbi:MAG: hypothetical protein V1777_04865 [Candidatus Micrarchaeota archaeon]
MALFVLDAAALLNSRFSFDQKHRYATPSLVFDEWKSYSQKLLAENAFQNGILSVIDPCPLSVLAAQKLAQKTGTKRLSAADEAVVALAVELKERRQRPIVLTDDYSVQNLLKHSKIKFIGVLRGEIKEAKTFAKPVKTAKIAKKTLKTN